MSVKPMTLEARELPPESYRAFISLPGPALIDIAEVINTTELHVNVSVPLDLVTVPFRGGMPRIGENAALAMFEAVPMGISIWAVGYMRAASLYALDRDEGSAASSRISAAIVRHAGLFASALYGERRTLRTARGTAGVCSVISSPQFHPGAVEEPKFEGLTAQSMDSRLSEAAGPGGLLSRVASKLRLTPPPLVYLLQSVQDIDTILRNFDVPPSDTNAYLKGSKPLQSHAMAVFGIVAEEYNLSLDDVVQLDTLLCQMAMYSMSETAMNIGSESPLRTQGFGSVASGSKAVSDSIATVTSLANVFITCYVDAWEAIFGASVDVVLSDELLKSAEADWTIKFKAGPLKELAATLSSVVKLDTWDGLRMIRSITTWTDHPFGISEDRGKDIKPVSLLTYCIPSWCWTTEDATSAFVAGAKATLNSTRAYFPVSAAIAPRDLQSAIFSDNSSYRKATGVMGDAWPGVPLIAGATLLSASISKLNDSTMMNPVSLGLFEAPAPTSSSGSTTPAPWQIAILRPTMSAERRYMATRDTRRSLGRVLNNLRLMLPNSIIDVVVDALPNPSLLINVKDWKGEAIVGHASDTLRSLVQVTNVRSDGVPVGSRVYAVLNTSFPNSSVTVTGLNQDDYVNVLKGMVDGKVIQQMVDVLDKSTNSAEFVVAYGHFASSQEVKASPVPWIVITTNEGGEMLALGEPSSSGVVENLETYNLVDAALSSNAVLVSVFDGNEVSHFVWRSNGVHVQLHTAQPGIDVGTFNAVMVDIKTEWYRHAHIYSHQLRYVGTVLGNCPYIIDEEHDEVGSPIVAEIWAHARKNYTIWAQWSAGGRLRSSR